MRILRFENFIFLLVLSAFSSSVHAETDVGETSTLFRQAFTKLACRKNIEKTLPPLLNRKTWVPLLVSEPAQNLKHGVVFRNSKTGFSYSLYGTAESSTYAVLDIKKEEVTKTTWLANSCDKPSIVKTKKASTVAKSPKDGFFTDTDLQKTLQAKNWGVIYIWTPYMPLSVDALAEIKKAVTNKNGTLTVLMDRNASTDQANKWLSQGLVQKQELLKADAQELFERGLGVHYPVAYIYENGFLSNSEFIGYKTTEMYSKWIQIQRQKIQEEMK